MHVSFLLGVVGGSKFLSMGAGWLAASPPAAAAWAAAAQCALARAVPAYAVVCSVLCSLHGELYISINARNAISTALEF